MFCGGPHAEEEQRAGDTGAAAGTGMVVLRCFGVVMALWPDASYDATAVGCPLKRTRHACGRSSTLQRIALTAPCAPERHLPPGVPRVWHATVAADAKQRVMMAGCCARQARQASRRRAQGKQAHLCCSNLPQGVQEVVAARAALQMLLEGQDYAGALDLLEVVVHSMEANHALGVTAFSEALPQVCQGTQASCSSSVV